MKLKLVVREGPRKGTEFLIKSSVVIGRSDGEILLRDKQASQIHAKITCDNNGVVEIEDLNSSNGTFVNGVRVQRSTLKVGDEITIGVSRLLLEILEPRQKAEESDLGDWQVQLDGFFAQVINKPPKNAKSVSKTRAFQAPLELEFISGIQAGQKIIFGYGPRQVGAFCSEGLLHEIGTPPVAFELRPMDGVLCEFKTKETAVLLNGSHIKSQALKNGDRISVGRTVIVIRALETL